MIERGQSIRAMMRQKHAGEHAPSAARMRDGPYLAEDGYTLVIPSDFYSEAARAAWRRWGFTYNDYYRCWERDLRRPLPGYTRPHRPEVWLRSVRAKFYEIFSFEQEGATCQKL